LPEFGYEILVASAAAHWEGAIIVGFSARANDIMVTFVVGTACDVLRLG
jgi:hypothetical protein